MTEIGYDRMEAVFYAKQWAYKRNPQYMDFDTMGGDCTNFASQCIYAGCKVMNYALPYGWFYISPQKRSASWTGVQYLYNFLINNKGQGPYAKLANVSEIEIGDIVQLGDMNGNYYHTPIICGFDGEEILVAAHTYDSYNRPLSSYSFYTARFIHILGARKI